jgi:hypothetical protein
MMVPGKLARNRCKSFDLVAGVATKLRTCCRLASIILFMHVNIQMNYPRQQFTDAHKSSEICG